MLFFRIFQHLLPRSAVWKLAVGTTLRKFFEGLSAEPLVLKESGADAVWAELSPETTSSLNEWERQFGLELSDMDTPAEVTAGRLALAAEWAATGGQSPSYIQGVLQAAGFDVYVHEWWSSGPPYVARDPRDYTEQPLIGSFQCTGDGLPSQPQCSAFASQPQCNGWLANEISYLVNNDLTRRAPPAIPDDPDFWPYFFYIGAETFPEIAVVDSNRRAEFERLVLKLRPTHLWVVLRITYTDPDEESLLLTEDGEFITTEDEDLIET